MSESIKRVTATDEAREVINRLKGEKSQLMFHYCPCCCHFDF
jgi:uncharacterized protein (DUF779 family)